MLVEKWDDIPHYEYGICPEDIPDGSPRLYRLIIAKRAIMAAYGNEINPNDIESAITDILADLRHLCDFIGLDFYEKSEQAYEYYSQERWNKDWMTAVFNDFSEKAGDAEIRDDNGQNNGGGDERVSRMGDTGAGGSDGLP